MDREELRALINRAAERWYYTANTATVGDAILTALKAAGVWVVPIIHRGSELHCFEDEEHS